MKKKIKTESKNFNYLQPLETGSAMEASRTELPGRIALVAQGGHAPNILIDLYIYMSQR